MRNLLSALQEGRLIELPTADKVKALEYLAVLIEAVPGIAKTDIVKGVLDREEQANTGLGKGIACPHLRVRKEGGIVCAVGWSKQGIDYGAPDGMPVHLVIMYYVPDCERNTYLKEISGLAKSVMNAADGNFYQEVLEIDSIRNKMLDWVENTVNQAIPDAKARMIRLEVKHAAVPVAVETQLPASTAGFEVSPFILVALELGECKVMSQDLGLVNSLERDCALYMAQNNGQLPQEIGGYQISVVSHFSYPMGRAVYNCVAIRSREPKFAPQ
jgi:mannitol/fructose-specific phosphotransferase system IIA component (Ntr-type)